MKGAARNGYLEVLKLLHENCDEGSLFMAIQLAAEHGHTKCVKYLFDYIPTRIPREDFVNVAASSGYLELIKYFHSNEHFASAPKRCTTLRLPTTSALSFLHENRTEGCKVDTLFDCDKRGLYHVVEYLFASRPMQNPAKAIARAKHEGRLLLAARLERSADTTNVSYMYR